MRIIGVKYLPFYLTLFTSVGGFQYVDIHHLRPKLGSCDRSEAPEDGDATEYNDGT